MVCVVHVGDMDRHHTYFLPARGVVIGTCADDPGVREMLRELWAEFGHEDALPFEGVSYIPSDRRARIAVQREGRMEVFDVPMNPHPSS